MEKEGLKPTPEADRYTLARRLALDLTGLPPTIEMSIASSTTRAPTLTRSTSISCWPARPTANAGPQVWLDLARYADSNGYADGQPRTIWKYPRLGHRRDQSRMCRIDRFTIEQIAGDMLPKPTVEQILATAFHRNTLTNTEGGTSDEEFRDVAVVDRVNTTMQVWMGITMACAQCHDHKYDPISQEEYFRMFAIFNQTEDSDKSDNSPNMLVITGRGAQRRRRSWKGRSPNSKRSCSRRIPNSTLLS